MTFDLSAPVFDAQGTYLEEQAVHYEDALMDQFTASPEGQALSKKGVELGWTHALLHYAITSLAVTPPAMTLQDLEEVVFSLFPRKVVTERGDGAEIIQELHAFWQFLQRAYHLPRASQMLALLTPQAARRLEEKLQDPTNFGMAKSFVLLGKEAGFDMETPEGMQAWVAAYNATVAPQLGAPTWPPSQTTLKRVRRAPKRKTSIPQRKKQRT